MEVFTVVSPVQYDGQHYPIGSPIQLGALAAAPLLDAGSITAPAMAAALLGETLRGSDYLPILIRFTKDLTVPQVEIVERAFKASGLDHAGWNGLSDDDRELRLAAACELVRDQARDPALAAGDGLGIGRTVAAAEGERVMRDNQLADPEAAAADRVVVQHIDGAANVIDGDAVQSGTVIGEAANGTATASATLVVDPIAATHTHTETDGAKRRGRS